MHQRPELCYGNQGILLQYYPMPTQPAPVRRHSETRANVQKSVLRYYQPLLWYVLMSQKQCLSVPTPLETVQREKKMRHMNTTITTDTNSSFKHPDEMPNLQRRVMVVTEKVHESRDHSSVDDCLNRRISFDRKELSKLCRGL